MAPKRLARRVALTAGAAAFVGMVSLTAACGETTQPPEESTTTTTTTTTTTPPVKPTENFPDFGPTMDTTGPNSFEPTDRAPRDPGF
ncbi:hypothetical protein FR943_13950 [Mycobacterium sp. TNTM28]|uniref:Lipoprotein n=1 Tax=[Mycobacterium] fortunisiensis TaxID=2600579 RepID=A0ABS6KMV0_9MYCO|nr:hypothetical protein [[Mycobacterium] fortunisiensis]MBU9764940.1 hypothetical protein [[Mycobacterium] fortunisiensis]